MRIQPLLPWAFVLALSTQSGLARGAEGIDAEAAGVELPPLFGRSRTLPTAPSEAELQARRAAVRGQIDAGERVRQGDVFAPAWYFDDLPDPGTPRGADWDLPPHRATIFLNFFGGTLTSGNNSALMQGACVQGSVEIPPFKGSESQALAIIQIYKDKMAPYGVRVAYLDAPPPELPYAMVMMGGLPSLLGMPASVLGVSCSSDCGDRWWRDTTHGFTEASSQTSVLGTVSLHEAAHAFGLGHVDGSDNIMYPYAGPGDPQWADGCTAYNDATGGINCKPTHDKFCAGGQQDSAAELLAYFGPNSPDTVAPTVEITRPTEDAIEIEPGGGLTVEADIADDHEGVGWKLEILAGAEPPADGEEQVLESLPAFAFETSWSVAGFAEGTYRVRVQAIDHDRNVGFDEVTVYVGQPVPAEMEDSGGTSGGTEGGTSDGGTGDDSGGTAAANTSTEDGCACVASAPSRVPGLAWTVLVLLVGFRRGPGRSGPT